MTDTDLRNQIIYIRAAAESIRESAVALLKILDAKLNEPLPSLADAVRAMKDNPWPDDVDAACRRAGAEEEP